MYPTSAQGEALVRAFGCARVVFNDALAARRAAYAAGQPYLSDAAVFAELTKVKGTNFFNSMSGKRKGPAVRMPKFRSRKD